MNGFKGITLNTPPEETAHIYAEDDAAIFQSIAGADGVFAIGQQCKATTLSNNKIRIADGVVIIGGHFARIPYGEYEDCEIENGESGKKRNDIIVAVFETTGTGGIDKMHCTVKKGVAGSAAVDPELKQDDIYNNGKIRELPLYRVKIEGLSIVAVEQMFKLKSDMSTLNKSLSDNVSELGDSYIKFANGFLLQWGTTAHDKTKLATSDVNLPVPYRDAGYRVSLTPGRNGNLIEKFWVGDSGGNNNNRTPNHFNVSSEAEQTTYDRAIEWITIGRWK